MIPPIWGQKKSHPGTDRQASSDPRYDVADAGIGAGIRDDVENDATDPVPDPDQTLIQSPVSSLLSCATRVLG